MTKSRPSATKLRLSKLFRWLAIICLIKLSILGALMLDIPVPFLHWQTDEHPTEQPSAAAPAALQATGPDAVQDQQAAAADSAADSAALAHSNDPLAPENMPQGPEAARLAAAAQPRPAGRVTSSSLAVPEFTGKVSSRVRGAETQEDAQGTAPGTEQAGSRGAAFAPAAPQTAGLAAEPARAQDPVTGLPHMETPPPLEAPLAEAGQPAPLLAAHAAPAEPHSDAGLLDMLGLKRLPIPGLGSVQAAHAASLDMPVPQASTGGARPFAPVEQLTPTATPGMPMMPGTPAGQQPRAANQRDTSRDLPNLPQGHMPLTAPAPAPRVQSAISPDDPNEKAQELARQQQDILMLRRQMDERLKDLENTEKKVQDMIREAKGLEADKVRRLIQMYANMKPRMAAKALENMDERVAVRILTGMAPKQSGEILTYTNPAKTAKFTELITRMRLPD